MNKRFLKIILYVIGVLLFQEVVLRICFPLPEIKNLDRGFYMNPAGAPNSRNRSRTWQSSLDTPAVFTHYMNGYGFRDAEWKVKRSGGKKRALFIGDSFVEGVMASQEETIPVGFNSVEGATSMEVFNGGMVGKGLPAYLAQTADLLPIFKPDVAFMVIYGNDMGQTEPALPQFSLEPFYYDWYVPRFVEVLRTGGDYGPIFPIWDTAPQPYLVGVPKPSNPWTQNAAGLTPEVTPEVAKTMQAGTFNPFRTNALQKEAQLLKLQPKLGETVPFFKYLCTENKVQPVIVYIPTRNQITRHYYSFEQQFCLTQCPDSLDLTTPEYQLHARVLASQCAQHKVQFINLTDIIQAKEAMGDHLFWNYDEHMKGKGYLLLGKTIRQRWKAP